MTTFHDILETIYMVTAGPGLLLAAMWGLRALSISREAIRVSENRAKLSATAEQIRQFGNILAPKIDAFSAAVDEKNIAFIKNWKIHLTPDGVAVEKTGEIENANEFLTIMDKFLPVANGLSAWASFFLIGVADEEIAYRTLSADFLHACELCIPPILVLEKTHAHRDMLDLYEIWRSRFEQDSLVEDTSKAIIRMAEINHFTSKTKGR